MDFRYIVDSHEDVAWNVCAMGRDFTRRVSEWTEDPEMTRKGGQRMVSLPDLLEARVRLIIGTIFVLPEVAANSEWNEGLKYYRNAAEAYAQGREQIDFYHTLAAHDRRAQIIRSATELDNFLANLDSDPDKLGIILSMEGADPIVEPAQLGEWVERGLRLIGPAWKQTRYCGGTGMPGPLTPDGFKLLAEMDRLGVILDISHMAEETFYQSLDAYQGTVIASHSNCRCYVNTDRQLSDDMIKRLIERQAVIGTVLYNRFLTGGNDATLEDAVRHISHICELAGNTQHVAIGSDFDGGFGSESIPQPMRGLQDFPLLTEALLKNGFSEQDVLNIFHGNWTRKLREGLSRFGS
jgi:membrane dipeptidase